MTDRLYCTLAELIDDLELNGIAPADEKTRAMDRIQAASDWVDKWGPFVPVTATRRFDGPSRALLFVDPLLTVTSLVNEGLTLTASDYLLYPRSRHWENGPYTRIELDPDSMAAAWTRKRNGVEIAGQWGKYEEVAPTGASVANPVSDSATALQVNNGARVSPGMVLLIETEQVLVQGTGAHSAAASLLAEAVDEMEAEIEVDNGAEFNVGEVIRVEAEELRVRDVVSNTLQVRRGWNGTTPSAHANDAAISVYRTYIVKRGVNGTSAASHTNGVAINRYRPPGDVNWLTRQIAGLMVKKAQGGFAGKNAVAELGEIFYHDEFPKKPVEEVLGKYRLMGI
jgi:hypothetical protein